jgi:hypothetical protein
MIVTPTKLATISGNFVLTIIGLAGYL